MTPMQVRERAEGPRCGGIRTRERHVLTPERFEWRNILAAAVAVVWLSLCGITLLDQVERLPAKAGRLDGATESRSAMK